MGVSDDIVNDKLSDENGKIRKCNYLNIGEMRLYGADLHLTCWFKHAKAYHSYGLSIPQGAKSIKPTKLLSEPLLYLRGIAPSIFKSLSACRTNSPIFTFLILPTLLYNIKTYIAMTSQILMSRFITL